MIEQQHGNQNIPNRCYSPQTPTRPRLHVPWRPQFTNRDISPPGSRPGSTTHTPIASAHTHRTADSHSPATITNSSGTATVTNSPQTPLVRSQASQFENSEVITMLQQLQSKVDELMASNTPHKKNKNYQKN